MRAIFISSEDSSVYSTAGTRATSSMVGSIYTRSRIKYIPGTKYQLPSVGGGISASHAAVSTFSYCGQGSTDRLDVCVPRQKLVLRTFYCSCPFASHPSQNEPSLSGTNHPIFSAVSQQISRLTERLEVAEGELGRLKRSCQFTALAEMLTAGEEYAQEVRYLLGVESPIRHRQTSFDFSGLLRAMTKDRRQSTHWVAHTGCWDKCL